MGLASRVIYFQDPHTACSYVLNHIKPVRLPVYLRSSKFCRSHFSGMVVQSAPHSFHFTID